MKVRAKKHLGQHFLKDENIAAKTANLVDNYPLKNWLEIGPGMGVLTQFLIKKDIALKAVEIDTESVVYLSENMPQLTVLETDFLKTDISDLFPADFGVIGNFPYNISSQILFKILENRDKIPAFAGMFQLEVGQRVASKPHSKAYGILSVLVQAFYEVKLEFQIPPSVFSPPPKVQSVVISGKKINQSINCNSELFFDVVKTAFQQRRKTLSNALKKFNLPKERVSENELFKLRAENLSVQDFDKLTDFIEKNRV
ncbi:MAG: 16S rRNA (adenine(1518)-N(6)/adenine(1519)-N(6))-dimethyltransferase RsmA [Bacteroidia bacterium]